MKVHRTQGSAACPLCMRDGVPLVNSHAVNDAFFKRLKKAGQFYRISVFDESVRKSQNTSESKLLCGDCEITMNNRYDRYSIRQFDIIRKILDDGRGSRRVRLEDSTRLAGYLASVFWRASLLKSGPYASFDVPENVFVALDAIVREMKSPFAEFTFSLRQAIGPKGPVSDRVLIFPQSMTGETRRNFGNRTIHLMRFTVMGIECMAFHGKVPHSRRFRPGIIKSGSSSVFIPKFDFSEDPFLSDAVRIVAAHQRVRH